MRGFEENRETLMDRKKERATLSLPQILIWACEIFLISSSSCFDGSALPGSPFHHPGFPISRFQS